MLFVQCFLQVNRSALHRFPYCGEGGSHIDAQRDGQRLDFRDAQQKLHLFPETLIPNP